MRDIQAIISLTLITLVINPLVSLDRYTARDGLEDFLHTLAPYRQEFMLPTRAHDTNHIITTLGRCDRLLKQARKDPRTMTDAHITLQQAFNTYLSLIIESDLPNLIACARRENFPDLTLGALSELIAFHVDDCYPYQYPLARFLLEVFNFEREESPAGETPQRYLANLRARCKAIYSKLHPKENNVPTLHASIIKLLETYIAPLADLHQPSIIGTVATRFENFSGNDIHQFVHETYDNIINPVFKSHPGLKIILKGSVYLGAIGAGTLGAAVIVGSCASIYGSGRKLTRKKSHNKKKKHKKKKS